MMIAGLTGNFGMGKSYVLSVFRSLGAVTLDSDRIVGMLLRDTNVIREVRTLLGDEVVREDGSLDKQIVAEKIFRSPELKKGLEGILHPKVFAKINDFIGRMKDGERIVIVEVPLLFEGNYEHQYEKIITVHTTPETAMERLMGSGFSQEQVLARLKCQLPIGVKKSRADYTVDNSGTKEKTREQVEKIYCQLLSELSGPGAVREDQRQR